MDGNMKKEYNLCKLITEQVSVELVEITLGLSQSTTYAVRVVSPQSTAEIAVEWDKKRLRDMYMLAFEVSQAIARYHALAVEQLGITFPRR